MDRLMETLWRIEGKRTGNPEFDPKLHELDETNALWIEVINDSEETVATSAAKLLETQDFAGLTRSYQLWYGDKIRFMDPLDIVVDPDVTLPSGRLVFDGAMWVRPDKRHQGFSWILGRLLKAVTFDRWAPDWFFGLAFTGISKSRLPVYSYGYPRLDRFANAYGLPGYVAQDLSLASMSRAEYVRQAEVDLDVLAALPDLSVGPELALRVRGCRQAATYEQTLAIIASNRLDMAS